MIYYIRDCNIGSLSPLRSNCFHRDALRHNEVQSRSLISLTVEYYHDVWFVSGVP